MAGRILYVGAGKVPSGTEYPTIKAACAAALSGELVHVYPGTYVEDNPVTIPAGDTYTGSVHMLAQNITGKRWRA